MGLICRIPFLVVLFFSAVAFENWNQVIVNNNLAKCLQNLIENEKINTYTRTVRISFEVEPVFKYRIWEIANYFLSMKYTSNKITFEISAAIMKGSQYDTHTRVFFVDSFDSFRFLLTQQRKHSKDINGIHQSYYIALINEQTDQRLIERCFDFCLANYIVNVNLLVEEVKNETITVYTYYPFTESGCGESTPTIHNRFVNGKLEWNRQTFPRKLRNMWQCPVRAVLWQKPPFVVMENHQVSGIDGNFLKFLAKAMNFTLEIYESPGGLGEVMSNGTAIGAFKIIEDREGDLMAGATICNKLRREHFASTDSYFGASLETIVKRPTPYSSLEILLFPFDNRTWLSFLVVYIGKPVLGILWKFITRVAVEQKTSSTKFLLLSWLLSIMILRSSYEGSIFKFLHNRPRRQVPHNFEEALVNGYKFMAKSTYFPSFKHIPGLNENFIPLDVDIPKLLDEFDKHKGKYGLINIDNFLTTISNDTTRCVRYVQIKEAILHNIICLYMPKFSFLTQEFNYHIQMITNNGHMQKIYDTAVTDKLRKFQKIQSEHFSRMKLKQLLGAFQLLFVLMSFSLLCFMLEVASQKCQFLKNIIDFMQ